MYRKKDRSMIKFLSKVIIFTLLIVFICRHFFFEFYTISTSQMESSLVEGDEVLVSKLSYGPRLPITLLSIPFVDNKYYSDLLQLPYKRILSKRVSRNDVVVFNNPLEIDKPIDKRNLLISRCVALPGDTVVISNGVYYVNNQEYIYSPSQLQEYFAPRDVYDNLKQIAEELHLVIKKIDITNDTVYFTMNRYDEYILKQNSASNSFRKRINDDMQIFRFILPASGQSVPLDRSNIKLYWATIKTEQKEKATLMNNEIYISDKKADNYTFQDDYYWVLSDNNIEALDSRMLGFIPFSSIVGHATTILYSKGQNGFRQDRLLTAIK